MKLESYLIMHEKKTYFTRKISLWLIFKCIKFRSPDVSRVHPFSSSILFVTLLVLRRSESLKVKTLARGVAW